MNLKQLAIGTALVGAVSLAYAGPGYDRTSARTDEFQFQVAPSAYDDLTGVEQNEMGIAPESSGRAAHSSHFAWNRHNEHRAFDRSYRDDRAYMPDSGKPAMSDEAKAEQQGGTGGAD